MPGLLDRNLRYRRNLCICHGKAIFRVTCDLRLKSVNRQLFNGVGDVSLPAVNTLRDWQLGKRMRPTVLSVQLDGITNRGGLTVNRFHQLNIHGNHGVRVEIGTIRGLPHLVDVHFSRRRRSLRIRDRETTCRIARHLRGEALNSQLLNRVRNISFLALNERPLRKILERMRPAVLDVQLDRITNRRLLPTSRFHELNLHRHRQRRIKILTLKRLPGLGHRDLSRRRRNLRVRNQEAIRGITRDLRGKALNSNLFDAVRNGDLLTVNGFGGRQIRERVCPCVLRV